MAYLFFTAFYISVSDCAKVTLILTLLKRFGLSFLDRFTDYKTVLFEYHKHGKLPFHNENRSALSAAIICCHIGDLKSAENLFERALDNCLHPGFMDHVEKFENFAACNRNLLIRKARNLETYL